MALVLVVEDEFGIADLFDAVLVDDGHRVLIATNGRQGLAILETEEPDLIFLDYMMPIMDGAAMLRSMSVKPELVAIPVVMMSSMPEAAVAERCQGYATFLRKPFRIKQISSLVEELLGTGTPPTAV